METQSEARDLSVHPANPTNTFAHTVSEEKGMDLMSLFSFKSNH